MPPQTLQLRLSRKMKPLCPRDSHVMRYETAGLTRAADGGQAEPCYHCGYQGCSVRYHPDEGYFTVVKTPDEPYFLEEPGSNLYRCARHGGWMYRSTDASGQGLLWRCAVPDCDFTAKEDQ